MSEIEQSVQDVSSESSSPSPESQTSANVPAESQQASPQETKEAPFHEHPRFKELINQRNEFSKRLQDYEQRFKELNSRVEQQSAPKQVSPEAKLLERLKGIDPEFGSWAEQQHAAKSALEQKLAAMEQWKTAQEQQAQRSQISSSLERLHTEHKVPNEVRELYEAQLERMAKANPNLRMDDLPTVYKNIHDTFSKYLETVKRDTLASYSKEKTKDASVPVAPKGTSPKPGTPKFEYSKDPQEARAQIVKNAIKNLRNQ